LYITITLRLVNDFDVARLGREGGAYLFRCSNARPRALARHACKVSMLSIYSPANTLGCFHVLSAKLAYSPWRYRRGRNGSAFALLRFPRFWITVPEKHRAAIFAALLQLNHRAAVRMFKIAFWAIQFDNLLCFVYAHPSFLSALTSARHFHPHRRQHHTGPMCLATWRRRRRERMRAGRVMLRRSCR
jgi:hypothetical protein